MLDIGLQDIGADSLFPLDPGVEVIGASSDHLVVDVHEMAPSPRVGQRLRFRLGYGSLLRAMTSSCVAKRCAGYVAIMWSGINRFYAAMY